MKTISFISALFMVWGLTFTIQAQENTSAESSASHDAGQSKEAALSAATAVQVYYFHYSRRCATCLAVEEVSRDAVADLHNDQVIFESVDMDEEAGAARGEAMKVDGQSLLIVSGDSRADLTNEAFMTARSHPDKLKELIQKKVNKFL